MLPCPAPPDAVGAQQQHIECDFGFLPPVDYPLLFVVVVVCIISVGQLLVAFLFFSFCGARMTRDSYPEGSRVVEASHKTDGRGGSQDQLL
jgi:hypothetical protein